MQLNRFTDYGLRVLMYLHGEGASPLVTVDEIAERFGIPRNHLNKIVGRLSKLGWVIAKPGRNGGIRLASKATPLLLGDVLRELEGHPSLIDCSKPPCPLRGGCHLKRVLDLGRSDFYANMNRYSLAELVQGPTAGLIAELHRSAPSADERLLRGRMS